MRLDGFIVLSFCFLVPSQLADAEGFDCSSLSKNRMEMMRRGEILPDLVPLALDDPISVCVWKTPAGDKEHCRNTRTPYKQLRPPPNPNWNGIDLKRELLQLILSQENYESCRDIFENDNVLSKTLESASDLNQRQIQRYEFQSRFVRSYTDISDEEWTPPNFSLTQRKLFGVFDSSPDWAYCAEDKWGRLLDGNFGRIVAKFDSRSRLVTFYNGLCTSKDLYGINISLVSSTHAAFLMSAHEFGHVLDVYTGNIREAKQSEAYATYFGTLFAECAARRFNELKRTFLLAIQKSPNVSKLDKEYAQCETRYWSEMEIFFRNTRAAINLNTGDVPRSLESLNSEMVVNQ